MSHLSIAKFGGTSVANHSAMLACANIVINNPNIRVVVLSASAGITNLLVELANGIDTKQRCQTIAKVREIQENILCELQNDQLVRPIIEKYIENIEYLAEAASLATSNALSDELISHGEMMSTQIFIQVLRELNIQATWLDVRNIISTNDNFGKAVPNDEQTQINSDRSLKPLIERGELVITQGFIGREHNGKTTTLGRGGSDYSAALLAEILNAKEVQIWTDVAGIYTTDPRIVHQAKRIDTISFAEAAEMATFGAKVLHPATLLPAVRSNIPVYVGSSKTPQAGGTWVTRVPHSRPTFRAIALRRDQTLLTLSSLNMLHAQGFLAKVFNILANHRISVDIVTTSEVSISLTLDKTGSSASGSNLLSQSLFDELSQYCTVKTDTDLSLVALIGNDLHITSGVAKHIFETLEPYNIRLISYGASTNNICMLVPSPSADTVVSALHNALFE
ncbi:lysine-sensitive aspartokinase 3 [Rodentibacter caecimuris]|uniref:Aspartokinase n=1 Tax=Rodentibacter caecimuris TaxID=1796644 RepID=A0ABX3KXA0_9PAST|nr:lysine-sensitive aspartokinase 3 [Rodentibacter heylii]